MINSHILKAKKLWVLQRKQPTARKWFSNRSNHFLEQVKFNVKKSGFALFSEMLRGMGMLDFLSSVSFLRRKKMSLLEGLSAEVSDEAVLMKRCDL